MLLLTPDSNGGVDRERGARGFSMEWLDLKIRSNSGQRFISIALISNGQVVHRTAWRPFEEGFDVAKAVELAGYGPGRFGTTPVDGVPWNKVNP
jgi:hypothetical protein